jgi:hypothetical protein
MDMISKTLLVIAKVFLRSPQKTSGAHCEGLCTNYVFSLTRDTRSCKSQAGKKKSTLILLLILGLLTVTLNLIIDK